MAPSPGKSASGDSRWERQKAANEVPSTPPPATAKAVADAAKSLRQIEDGEIFEGTMDVDSSPHPALPAGSSAVAKQSADYFTFHSAPDADSSCAANAATCDQTQEAPDAASSAAANYAADDQIQEGLDSQLGIYRMFNVKNVLKQDLGGFQPLPGQVRGHGHGDRGQSRGRGQFQGRGQSQGQGYRGETKYPIVGDYSQESL